MFRTPVSISKMAGGAEPTSGPNVHYPPRHDRVGSIHKGGCSKTNTVVGQAMMMPNLSKLETL